MKWKKAQTERINSELEVESLRGVRCVVRPGHSIATYHIYGENKYTVMGLELLSIPTEIYNGRVQITTNPTQILDTGLC